MIDLDAMCTCGHIRDDHDANGRYCDAPGCDCIRFVTEAQHRADIEAYDGLLDVLGIDGL